VKQRKAEHLFKLKDFSKESFILVQALSIPFILSGRDVLVRAPEGTGKTTSFLLALVQKLLMSQRKTKLSPKKGKACTKFSLSPNY